MSESVTVFIEAGCCTLRGTLNKDNMEALQARLLGGNTIACIEMLDLEIDDGVACAALVTLVRHLASLTPLCLSHVPQSLAHTLYRCGELSSGRITLESPREEEPYG